jgi:hypothetical protein
MFHFVLSVRKVKDIIRELAGRCIREQQGVQTMGDIEQQKHRSPFPGMCHNNKINVKGKGKAFPLQA